jgi:WD40 repeat protein
VWDAANGAALLTLRHEGSVRGAEWNRDETHLLTWSDDRTARVWPVDLDQMISLAKSYRLRPLNNDELAQFLLPTLEPTITPTPLPTITSLPTLTPSAAPMMATATP